MKARLKIYIICDNSFSFFFLEQPNVKLKNIGDVINILTYAENEWKGETTVAEKIKQVCFIEFSTRYFIL